MKTVLVTLCIGQHRVEDTLTLIETFKQFTDYDIVIVTDIVSSFSDKGVDVIALSDITDMPPYLGKYHSVFNYNLKGVVTKFVYEKYTDHKRVIWSDCDVYLTKPCTFLEAYTEANLYGIVAKASVNKDFLRKFLELKSILNLERDDCLTVNECMLIFTRSVATDQFMRNWVRVIEASYRHGLKPYYEMIEIGIALEMTNDMSYHNTLEEHTQNRREGSLLTKDQRGNPHHVL